MFAFVWRPSCVKSVGSLQAARISSSRLMQLLTQAHNFDNKIIRIFRKSGFQMVTAFIIFGVPSQAVHHRQLWILNGASQLKTCFILETSTRRVPETFSYKNPCLAVTNPLFLTLLFFVDLCNTEHYVLNVFFLPLCIMLYVCLWHRNSFVPYNALPLSALFVPFNFQCLFSLGICVKSFFINTSHMCSWYIKRLHLCEWEKDFKIIKILKREFQWQNIFCLINCLARERSASLMKRRAWQPETCPVCSFNWNYNIHVMFEDVRRTRNYNAMLQVERKVFHFHL